MKNYNYWSPVLNKFGKSRPYGLPGRVNGRSLFLAKYFKQFFPEIQFNPQLDFLMNPKHIPKVKKKSDRKVLYQSFALYKKSFKPEPKLKIYRDEWKWKTSDLADAMSFSFLHLTCRNQSDFEKQYMCSWDLAAEN